MPGESGSRECRASRAGVRGRVRESGVRWGRECRASRESRGRESGEKNLAIWMQPPRRGAEYTIRGSLSSPPAVRRSAGSAPRRVAGSVCDGLVAPRLSGGSRDSRPRFAAEQLVPPQLRPEWRGPGAVRLSMRWDAFWLRPAERPPGVGSSVGRMPLSMRKHGGRGRLARRWMCGLVLIRVRAASEARIVKAARAVGLLAIAGVPRVGPPRSRGVLPSSPPGAEAPGLGIAEAPREGAFRSKGS